MANKAPAQIIDDGKTGDEMAKPALSSFWLVNLTISLILILVGIIFGYLGARLAFQQGISIGVQQGMTAAQALWRQDGEQQQLEKDRQELDELSQGCKVMTISVKDGQRQLRDISCGQEVKPEIKN